MAELLDIARFFDQLPDWGKLALLLSLIVGFIVLSVWRIIGWRREK